MKIEITPCDGLPCQPDIFQVNGIDMDLDYFGKYKSDPCPDDCEGYDCHNKRFSCYDINIIRKNIEDKINLTDEEIKTICQKLTEIFNVGNCGLCI
jgi:hypothetical protein